MGVGTGGEGWMEGWMDGWMGTVGGEGDEIRRGSARWDGLG